MPIQKKVINYQFRKIIKIYEEIETFFKLHYTPTRNKYKAKISDRAKEASYAVAHLSRAKWQRYKLTRSGP